MELPFRLRVQSTPLVPSGLERRSAAPGDMKSPMVEEMSILWSAIGGLELVQGGAVVFISTRSSTMVEGQGGAGQGHGACVGHQRLSPGRRNRGLAGREEHRTSFRVSIGHFGSPVRLMQSPAELG